MVPQDRILEFEALRTHLEVLDPRLHILMRASSVRVGTPPPTLRAKGAFRHAAALPRRLTADLQLSKKKLYPKLLPK